MFRENLVGVLTSVVFCHLFFFIKIKFVYNKFDKVVRSFTKNFYASANSARKFCRTSASVTKKKVEDDERKQMSSSRSFIPLISASGNVGKRTSLRLGALPDPVQLRTTPTLSIDDLKRRIYRRMTPSTAVSSNSDGVSSSSILQKNASYTSPGQSCEVSDAFECDIL